MDKLEFTIKTKSQLPKLASRVIQEFPDIRVFLFNGELGAGKTTFIKTICKVLEVEDDLSSPSYAIINEYKSKHYGSLYHLDCYRLKDENEAWDLGISELFESGSYCFVEWPEKTHNLLPLNYVLVDIQVEEQKRIFNFTRL